MVGIDTNVIILLELIFRNNLMSQLPILMYHNVCEPTATASDLTISTDKLEAQLMYLKQKGYQTYHFKELEQNERLTPHLADKAVVLTFDDVTVNQLEYAVPLLEKYQMKATFFIPFKYLGKVDSWNAGGEEPIMSLEQIKGLPANIELGFHSYEHRRFTDLSPAEIKIDFDNCMEVVKSHQLQVYPAIAYPYGNFPKKDPKRLAFFKLMRQNGMTFGLRIGNKINSYPFKEPFEIKRLDVKGAESLFKFKLKLRFGKLF